MNRAEQLQRDAAEQRRMVRAILRHYDASSAAELADGVAWYGRAAGAAQALADLHGVTFEVAAGVIAALSPRMTWRANVAAADRVIAAYVAGEPAPRVGLGASVTRAWRVLKATAGADLGPILGASAPKVRAFHANITGDHHAVTVDVWAMRAAEACGDAKGARYGRVAAAYRVAAAARGLSPRDLQAAVWVHIRGGAE